MLCSDKRPCIEILLRIYKYVWDIKLSWLTAVIWSATRVIGDIISVFSFLWNLLYYAEYGQPHCEIQLLEVLVYSRDFYSFKGLFTYSQLQESQRSYQYCKLSNKSICLCTDIRQKIYDLKYILKKQEWTIKNI